MKRGKKWSEARSKIDKTKEYSLNEAIDFLKQNAHVKFNQTLDI